jgi:hypothetical protein
MDLHSALKTEEISRADANGTKLALVRLIHGKDKSTLTIHANPTTFSFSGLQTTDILAMLGFIRSSCAFMTGGQCYARSVGENFNLDDFARVFPLGSKAVYEAYRLLQNCGLDLGANEGWGYFYGMQSGRRTHSSAVSGDGHTSPKTEVMKDKTDNLFRYVFTWIQGGSDKGWVTHIIPLNLPLLPEHEAIFRQLGFSAFTECPQNDFNQCWWFLTPFASTDNLGFDSNAHTAHRWFDNLETNFSPAIEKLLFAHKAFEPFDMPLLKITAKDPTIPLTSGMTKYVAGKSKREVNYKYDVAISYATEDIGPAEKLADILKEREINVFFDKKYEAELWGKDLFRHFTFIFQLAAKYCIIFVSQNYARKLWTNHELKSAQARALQGGDQDYILPVRLDDTEILGLLPTTGYLDIRTTPIEKVAELFIEKLRQ